MSTRQPPPSPRLPEAYGTRRLLLVAREPHWLYAHWDFSVAEQHALRQRAAAGRLALRIHRNTPDTAPEVEITLSAEARHWFVPVAHAETQYHAELGYHGRRHGWVSLARSNPVLTPADTVAPEASVTLATIPPDMPFDQALRTFRVVSPPAPNGHAPAPGKFSLAGFLRQMHAAGRPELPQLTGMAADESEPPADLALALARLAGASPLDRRAPTASPAAARSAASPDPAALWSETICTPAFGGGSSWS